VPPVPLRYAAFATDPSGGNPAGVVLDALGMGDEEMLAVAAELGYSESAFLFPRERPGHYDVRYFSPEAEVPFCGHATIASGVALADAGAGADAGTAGEVTLHTAGGPVSVVTGVDDEGWATATLTSVEPCVTEAAPGLLSGTLAALGWTPEELDPSLPARVAYAGAFHLILAAASRDRLARLSYDFAALKSVMLDRDLTTVDLVWREDATTFHARNPFPVGGVVEDPATGAAAAAFGAYLRDIGAVSPPVDLLIRQGHDMGRPSELRVHVDTAYRPAIRVTGAAVPLSATSPPPDARRAQAAGWSPRP